MANVTIRNLDDDVVETLKTRAKENKRSLEAELRALLTEAAKRPSSMTLRDLARLIRSMTPDVPQTDSAQLLREDRDR